MLTFDLDDPISIPFDKDMCQICNGYHRLGKPTDRQPNDLSLNLCTQMVEV